MSEKVKNTILEKLNEIERDNDVKILFAIESGSRGWGFESVDSDFDCRFVYVHKKEWYLSIFEGRDIIEIPVDAVLDINGWDLKKALQLLHKSNVPLTEWLTSPIVYKEVPGVRKDMCDLAEQFVSPISAIHHFINLSKRSMETMAENQIKVKKFFYALRPIIACMWIEKNKSVPPMNLYEMLAGLEFEQGFRDEIDALVAYKKTCTEADEISPPLQLMNFINQKLVYFEDFAKTITVDSIRDIEKMNGLFLDTLDRVWQND